MNKNELLYGIKKLSKEEKTPVYLMFIDELNKKEIKEYKDFFQLSVQAIRTDNSSTGAPGRLELEGITIPGHLPYSIAHNIASLLVTNEVRNPREEKTPQRYVKSRYNRKRNKVGKAMDS